MDSGALLRSVRERRGLSQRALALRAGTGQAAISRIERGEISPTLETMTRLLAAMGEQLTLETEPLPRDYDPRHLRATLRRPPAERLELAMSWNRLAERLSTAGERARGR